MCENIWALYRSIQKRSRTASTRARKFYSRPLKIICPTSTSIYRSFPPPCFSYSVRFWTMSIKTSGAHYFYALKVKFYISHYLRHLLVRSPGESGPLYLVARIYRLVVPTCTPHQCFISIRSVKPEERNPIPILSLHSHSQCLCNCDNCKFGQISNWYLKL